MNNTLEKLQEISTKLDLLITTKSQQHKSYLSLDEASQYLGISKNTLYDYSQKGVIPHYKPRGRKLYFKASDLENFIINKPTQSKG